MGMSATKKGPGRKHIAGNSTRTDKADEPTAWLRSYSKKYSSVPLSGKPHHRNG